MAYTYEQTHHVRICRRLKKRPNGKIYDQYDIIFLHDLKSNTDLFDTQYVEWTRQGNRVYFQKADIETGLKVRGTTNPQIQTMFNKKYLEGHEGEYDIHTDGSGKYWIFLSQSYPTFYRSYDFPPHKIGPKTTKGRVKKVYREVRGVQL